MRRLFVMALATCGVLSVGSAAFAQDSVYPPPPLTIVVDDDTPDPGAVFEVSLAGCTGGDAVVFGFGNVQNVARCASGSATQSFTAPSTPGQFSGEVSFVDPASSVGTFTIDIAGPRPVVEAPAEPETIPEDNKVVVVMLSSLAALASGLTISRLPRG